MRARDGKGPRKQQRLWNRRKPPENDGFERTTPPKQSLNGAPRSRQRVGRLTGTRVATEENCQ